MTGPRGDGPGPDPARDDPRAPVDRERRRRNADADWDRWPVSAYLAENHRGMHASDAAVIRHHCAFHQRLPADGVGRSLEFGAGPNLYPLMPAAATVRRVDALEPGAACPQRQLARRGVRGAGAGAGRLQPSNSV
ncbi:hypothetical protein [Streptomyces lavendulocolor]|uniref:hypothetical protein n=1 Tax=Streptomyces lavendulocolor TaxID=67316 RepID=UPI0031DDF3EF